jgi:hypothetical protein
MSDFPILEFLAGLILSGLAGVAATIWYQHWSADRQARWQIFRELCRYGPSHDGFLLALNELPAVFSGRPLVIEAHDTYLQSMKRDGRVFNDDLQALLRVVARDVGAKDLSELQLMHRFGGHKRG